LPKPYSPSPLSSFHGLASLSSLRGLANLSSIIAFAVLLALLVFPGAGGTAFGQGGNKASKELSSEPALRVLPDPLDRGSPARVILQGITLADNPKGTFDGKPIFFFDTRKGPTGLFGADIMIKTGEHTLKVSYLKDGEERELSHTVKVQSKDYGTRDIKVPDRQVNLSEEDSQRAIAEKKLTDKALSTVSPDKLWKGEFMEPSDAAITSSFGRKTRMNGILNPRPHAGADYNAPAGAPVRAPAGGVVILTGDHFFSGKAIYIDHGQGLISMYFHLSEILVEDGQTVTKGQTPIGLVGKTGRVTGAHLHYGVYLNGARIDPSVFRKMSGTLED
jgi:biotin carboxyl carrier protein